MRTLWEQYVFRRGSDANELWERLFESRPIRLLYIAGSGFDVRAQSVMREFINSLRSSGGSVEEAKLVLINFPNYQLADALKTLTEQNDQQLAEIFSAIGTVERIIFGESDGDEDLSASIDLRIGTDAVLKNVSAQTDIILDASSLPRVVYLSLMTSLLSLF